MRSGMPGCAAIVCMGPICHGKGPVPSNSSLQRFRATSITTTLHQIGWLVSGNCIGERTGAKLSCKLAYSREGIPKSPFMPTVVVILGLCPRSRLAARPWPFYHCPKKALQISPLLPPPAPSIPRRRSPEIPPNGSSPCRRWADWSSAPGPPPISRCTFPKLSWGQECKRIGFGYGSDWSYF